MKTNSDVAYGGAWRILRGEHHGPLDLGKGTNLDLSNPFAGDGQFAGQLIERHRAFRQSPRLEDMTFPRRKPAQRNPQGFGTPLRLLVIGEHRLGVDRPIDQQGFQLGSAFLATDARVQRHVAIEPRIHLDHLTRGHIELPGDQFGDVRREP
ncbi:hypothetical protein ACVIW3_003776 [Bradyrhizobium diazoefficiens]